MRIRRLDLLRYGRFTDAAFDLPKHDPDFHILFGPNEAGKSTALSAIEDFLFGIPHNSPLNFIHDYASMRIGAALERGTETIELRRRKGNRDTLLTSEGLPLSAGDGALAPFLGAADRTFLVRMFSLDHARLRQGGREIIEAQDEVGQMLFSAGAGLAGLRESLSALTEEGDALWAPRRAARREYYQAEDRLKEADGALRAHTVTAARWQELKRAHDDAQETYAALEAEIEQKTAEQRKLGRIRRIYRNIRRKVELDQAIDALCGAKALPEDALRTLQVAERDDSTAATRIETLRVQLEGASQERSALTYDPTLLLHDDDIKQLHERRITVRDEKADLPKRHAELAGAEADLRRLAAELEWDTQDINQLIARIPPRAKVGTVRTLLSRRGERFAAVESSKAAVEEVTDKLAELQKQRDAFSVLPDVSTLTAVIKATRDMGDLTAKVRDAEASITGAEADIRRWLDTLNPAAADAALLSTFVVPAHGAVQIHRDERRAMDQQIQACRERIRATKQERDRQRKSSERLARDEAAVAPDELSRARQHRDAGWSLIRRRHVEGLTVPEDAVRAFTNTEGELPDLYEKAVGDADHLADLRFDKAEAVAQLAVIARQIAEQEDLLHGLRQEAEALDEKSNALDAAWGEMWSALPFTPLAADVMLEWLAARKEALGAVERKTTAERQLAASRHQAAEAKTGLLAELAALGSTTEALADQPLAVVIEAAADGLRQHDRAAESKRQLDEAYRQANADAERKRRVIQKAEAAWSEWQGQWTVAITASGLDALASPEAIAAQVDAVDEMRPSVVKVNDLRHERIGKIERDVRAFIEDVARMTAILASDLHQTEAEEAVLQLERRLAEAQRRHDLQNEKDDAIAALELKIEECEASRQDARATIAHLQDAAGVADIAALKPAISASDQRRALEAELAQLLHMLAEEGDGLSIPELQAECDAVDLDQASAREASVSPYLAELRQRQLEAQEHRTAARQVFEAIGGDDAAATAAAARQEALAEMRQVAERYTRVRTAALLLHWAIDRYRREKQAPLLKRASKLFATLTSGSFSALRVDFDEQDRAHLIGVRPDDSTVPVPGMSTGTADQLYLALRVASVEDYLERAPPLPFVADDLFINFDDERAAAGFQVLGQLAAETQVLFFTHHQHLVDIARATLGASVPVALLHDTPHRQAA